MQSNNELYLRVFRREQTIELRDQVPLLTEGTSRIDKCAKQMETKRETNENKPESEQKVRLY